MAKKEFIKMTEDEFYAQFNCVKNHIDPNASVDGCMFETYRHELEYIRACLDDDFKRRTVWTIIEVEGRFYYVSGYHFVNRFGYLITAEPVKEDLEIEVAVNTEVDVDEQPKLHTAKLIEEITVIDPDTKGEVELAVYKHEGGGIFAMDISFLDQCVNTDDFDRPIVPDPFSDNGAEEGIISHVVLFD